MEKPMKAKSIPFTQKQLDYIARVSKIIGIPQNEWIRRAVDAQIEKEKSEDN